MANANPLRVVIQGVDRLTAPLRRINKRLETLRDPVRRLNGSFKAMAKESGLNRLGDSVRHVGDRVGNVVGRTRDLTAKLGALGAVAAGTFGVLVHGYTQSANETQQWADRLGISTQSLQELLYAAGKYNVEGDAMIDGLKELTMRADEFVVTGAGPAAEAFGRLGLSREQLRKTGGDTEKLFDLITSKMSEVKNTAARQRIGDELLGGQAAEQMVSWLGAGSEEMAASRQEAHKLGKVYKDSALKNAEAFTRTMGKLTGALEGARNSLLGPLIPTLNRLAESLSTLVADNQDKIRAFGKDLAERLPGALRDLGEGLKSLKEKFEAFLKFIEPITDRLGLLNTALVGIGLVVAGPLLMALGSLTMALVTLGVALLTTPVGWFLGAIALIAGAVYMLVKHWDGISTFFTDKFAAVREAFDQGLLQGVLTLLKEFNPVLLVMEAIDAIVEYVTGFSLSDAGSDLVNSLWDGIKAKFEQLTGWFKDKIAGLTDLVPDWMKDAGGAVGIGMSAIGDSVSGFFSDDDRGQATPAMSGRAANAVRGVSGGTTRSEASVAVRFENAPAGTRVEQQRNTGVDLGLDMGYSLPGGL